VSEMTRTDRKELAQLVRRREKIAKGEVDRVARERLADFEREAASTYRVGDDDVWAEQTRIATEAVEDAKTVIADRCRELGVAKWTAPTLQVSWYNRGENAVKERVVELRKVAKTRIDADATAAKNEVEKASVNVQEQLVAGGLDSEEAKRFLAEMPTAEALMPAVPLAEIEAKPGEEG